LKNSIFIVCFPRLTEILAEELKEHQFPVISTSPTGITTEGTFEDCMFLNLHLRTANRVLYQIAQFQAAVPDDLYKQAVNIPWDHYLAEDGFFSIHSFVKQDKINDTRYPNLLLKDAVADYFFKKYQKRPDSGSSKEQSVIFLHWQKNQAELFLDTSGETIARRGYRKHPGKAPLQETLAAAILKATRWQVGQPFINLMSGSGTLAIEAALIASNRAPGLTRQNFGFQHFRLYNPDRWQKLRRQAVENIIDNTGSYILVNDHDPNMVRITKNNAREAGVAHLLKYHTGSFQTVPLPSPPGIILLNPEYGERMGELETLEKTYQEIGDFFKKNGQGYLGYIFTGNLDLAKRVGLRTSRKIPFYNARIDCRLLEYELYSGSRKNTAVE
jgi:putative N6-adenine-specific DNA methylase